MQQVAIEMGRGETFNKAPVGVYFGSPGVEADDPYFGGVGPRRTGCISCGNCYIGCGHNAKNKLTTNYLYLAEKLGAEIHELHEVYDLVPLDGGGFEVHARHPGWAQRAAHLHRHTYTAEQVIVAAHAYGSAKLLLHMQHEGRLPGLSSELGQRARTNSEQLLSITRTHGEWKRDPEKIHITPGSVAITSGVWPDAVTSIEPIYWGVGSNVFAFLATYHQHGEQKHPIASWLKQLVEHPTQVLAFNDPRHWSERTVVMLCMQTTDTSIELYWHDGLLRSRHGSGTPPTVHIPVVEEFVDRLAKKMDSREGALLFEVINRTASAHFIGGIPIGDSSEQRRRRPLPARVRSARPSRHGRERDAGQPGSEPVTHDHRPGRARDVTLAEQGRRGHQAAAGFRLRARRPGDAAPSSRARRRSRRAATRREEVRHHPRLPLLNRPDDKEKPMTELATDAFRTVGPGDAIPNDFVVPYYLDDRKLRISIARVDDRLYAFDDLCTCTREACPLSGGLLTGTTIMCQCHGSRFDITTGAVINGPATEALNVYEVQEVEGSIQIRA